MKTTIQRHFSGKIAGKNTKVSARKKRTKMWNNFITGRVTRPITLVLIDAADVIPF